MILSRRTLLHSSALGAAALPFITTGSSAAVSDRILDRPLAKGLYEVAYSAGANAVFVACAQEFGDGKGGIVYRLDPVTLETTGTIEVPEKVFALAVNDRTGKLYAGNTLEGAITRIDIPTGKVEARLQLSNNKEIRTRQIRVDEAGDRILVTGVEHPSIVWVVDGTSFTQIGAVPDTGGSATGLALDLGRDRIYVGNNDAQIVVADPKAGKILERFTTGDDQKRFFVNVVLDEAARRLYAIEANERFVFVFDADEGTVLDKIEIGRNPLAGVVNPTGKRLYVTNRGEGSVSVIDTTTNQVVRKIELGAFPNSLVLDAEAKVLFVTVKQPLHQDDPGYDPSALDRIVRIPV